MMTRRSLFLSFLMATLLACSGSSSFDPASSSLDVETSALKGTTTVNTTSTATDLRTPEGIIGTVGALYIPSQYGGMEFGCTGTLVARDLFLTAAHCVLVAGSTWGGMYVVFPQDAQNSYSVDRAGIRVHPRATWASIPNGADLAVVPFQTPVPENVVANLAPVFTGNIEKLLSDRNHQIGDVIRVGMGRDNEGNYGPNRRSWGQVTTLWVESSSIGTELISERPGDSRMDKGDSGGPVFVMDNRGIYRLIGVNSGGNSYTVDGIDITASTGSAISGFNNANWLVEWLGDDVDADGVLDSADNCPPQRCMDAGRDGSDCWNPDQADHDGDGVGDICDNCPPSICLAMSKKNPQQARHFNCSNPGQENRDGDELGDACDLCPLVSNPATLADRDNDLVGDECDLCLGDDPYPGCVVGGFPCFNGECLGDARSGHCSQQTDSDRDGLPDACDDNCIDIPGMVHTVPPINSNSLAEKHYAEGTGSSLKPLGDWCDSVPLFRMEQAEKNVTSLPPAQERNVYNEGTVVDFFGETWIGCDAESGLCDPNLDPNVDEPMLKGGVAFKFCSCLNKDGSGPAFDEECTKRMVCDASTWDNPWTWREITVMGPKGQPVTVDRPLEQAFFDRRGLPYPHPLQWRFFDDTWSMRVPSFNDGGVRVHGLLGSHVVTGDAILGRDIVTGTTLRTVVLPVSAPDYAWRKPDANIPNVPVACQTPGCTPWLFRDGRDRINPNPMERILESIRSPAILTSDGKSVALRLPERNAFEVTNEVDGAVMGLIADPKSFAFVPRSENDSLLAAAGAWGKMAVVPREGSGYTSPALLALDDSRLVVSKRPPEIPFDGSVISQLASVVVPANGRVVYSAMKERLYIVGGAVGGAPIGRLRAYDFADDGWATVATELSFGERVLGLAFDVARERLYVLDVGDQGSARLAGIDLTTGKAVVYWEVPFSGLYERYALSTDFDGALVLVVSSGTNSMAWHFDLDAERREVRWQGTFEFSGAAVIDDPLFRGDRLVVPVASGETFRFQELGRLLFEESSEMVKAL